MFMTHTKFNLITVFLVEPDEHMYVVIFDNPNWVCFVLSRMQKGGGTRQTKDKKLTEVYIGVNYIMRFILVAVRCPIVDSD